MDGQQEPKNLVRLEGTVSGKVFLRNVGVNGKAVANFTLLVEEPFGGKVYKQYIKCVAWGNLADKISNAEEGTGVVVMGRLKNSSYDNKEGVKIYKTEVEATEITIKDASEFDPFSEIQ